MNGKSELDSVDLRILDMLQADARTPNAEIARRIGMAPSAVLERIRKLEKRGVILGYHARVNPKALDLGLTCFTFVRTEEPVGSVESGQDLADIPEVLEVHHTAGQDCYLLKVRVADTEHLSRLLKRFGRVPEVRDTRTTIVLTTVKETLGLPIAQADEPDAKE
ncbi:MAG: Lrp/AsnC family transcriptional regulator [Thermodesulfobacteriota bacterium]